MLGLAMAAAMVGKTVERLTPFPSVMERAGGRGVGVRARGGCKKRVVKRERRGRIESRRAASKRLPGKNGRRKKELWGCTRGWHE